MRTARVNTTLALLAAALPLGAADFLYPASGTITGRYNYCGSGRHHHGGNAIDIDNACHSPVYAARGGTARYYGGCRNFCSNGDGCNGAAGNYIQVYHAAGYKTRYLHGLGGTQNTGAVGTGTRVISMGSTGGSGRAHCHFDVWRNGVKLGAWIGVTRCYQHVAAKNGIPYDFPGIGGTSSDGGGGGRPANEPPIGFFDRISNGWAYGWALDKQTATTPITVHVYIDGPAGRGGTHIGTVTANRSRPDVNRATGLPGNHGFAYPIPSRFHRQPHSLYIYAIDSWGGPNPLLPGSPKRF